MIPLPILCLGIAFVCVYVLLTKEWFIIQRDYWRWRDRGAVFSGIMLWIAAHGLLLSAFFAFRGKP